MVEHLSGGLQTSTERYQEGGYGGDGSSHGQLTPLLLPMLKLMLSRYARSHSIPSMLPKCEAARPPACTMRSALASSSETRVASRITVEPEPKPRGVGRSPLEVRRCPSSASQNGTAGAFTAGPVRPDSDSDSEGGPPPLSRGRPHRHSRTYVAPPAAQARRFASIGMTPPSTLTWTRP